jgi:phosphoglycerate dehydrogenase-like enzyme
VVINTSRGGVIDEEALLRGLAGGRVAAAGLDVFAQEPLPDNHPLRSDPRVVATPHTAAFSEEALAEVADRSVCDVLRVLAGEPAHNPVPLPTE